MRSGFWIFISDLALNFNLSNCEYLNYIYHIVPKSNIVSLIPNRPNNSYSYGSPDKVLFIGQLQCVKLLKCCFAL